MIKRILYFGNPTYLFVKHSQLCIKKVGQSDEEIQTRPIEDIRVVILDHGQITLTHKAMQELQKNKVVMVSCDERHMPHSLTLPMEGHSEQSERYRNQLSCSLPLRKSLWQQTIAAKVRNQAAILEQLGRRAERLHVLARRVKSGDPENVEGQAAAYYWGEFLDGFLRDRSGDQPNGMLNYGYAIVRAMVARALTSSGLHLSLGIHHRNKYNAFCLADDIMEPFRPFVDFIAYDLYVNHPVVAELTLDMKAQLIAVSSTDGLFGGKLRPLMVGLSQTTSSLYECMIGKRRKIIYPTFPHDII